MSVAKMRSPGGAAAADRLLEQDGDGIDLLARGAARLNPDGAAGPLSARISGTTCSPRKSNASGSRKKLVTLIRRSRNRSRPSSGWRRSRSHADRDVVQLQHLHPAPDAAKEGGRLVAAEIVAELPAQDGADRLAEPLQALTRPAAAHAASAAASAAAARQAPRCHWWHEIGQRLEPVCELDERTGAWLRRPGRNRRGRRRWR